MPIIKKFLKKYLKQDKLMGHNIKLTILFILIGYLTTNNSFAQYKKDIKTTRILFIFDASNSMNGVWESGKKITPNRVCYRSDGNEKCHTRWLQQPHQVPQSEVPLPGGSFSLFPGP